MQERFEQLRDGARRARARPGDLACDPTRPAAWQCNAALRTRDLVRRGAPTSHAGPLFDALGVGGCDQLRVLVCEGRDVLAWVGTVRREPSTDLERRRLARIAPALRARLVFERLVGAEERARLTLEAALAQIPAPVFVVSGRGRVEGHNEVGPRSVPTKSAMRRTAVVRLAKR